MLFSQTIGLRKLHKYRGAKAQNWMCDCAKIHMYEVEFKLAGMRVVPTHKNCGNSLSEPQTEKFQKELVRSWGLDPEDEKLI